jgi:hypothetical protein
MFWFRDVRPVLEYPEDTEKNRNLLVIRGSHGSEGADSGLGGCDNLQSCWWLPKFKRNVSSHVTTPYKTMRRHNPGDHNRHKSAAYLRIITEFILCKEKQDRAECKLANGFLPFRRPALRSERSTATRGYRNRQLSLILHIS